MAKTLKSSSLKDQGKFGDEMKDWLDGQQMINFKEVRDRTLRPVSGFLVMARHWPVSLQSGKMCPPMWCPKLDSETQKFDASHRCHLHDDFGDRWRAQKVIIFAAIVREWQEENKKNPVGIIVLPGSMTQTLVKIVSINKYDVSDPAKGCDLSVTNAKEASAANRWQIQRTEKTPLTDEERQLVVPDLDKISPDFNDPAYFEEFSKSSKQKLANFFYYVTPRPEGGVGWEGYMKDVRGRPYTDFPELVDLVGDGKGSSGGSSDDKPKRRRHEEDDDRPRKATSKASKRDDDEDDEDDAKLKRRHVTDDDDEDAVADVVAAQTNKRHKDSEELPFEPDDKPKKMKVMPLEGYEEWSSDHMISWKNGPDGTPVPKCLGAYASATKCKRCPVRNLCLSSDQG